MVRSHIFSPPRVFQYVPVLALLLVVISTHTAHGQSTAFTYQGQLSAGGMLASGSYDVRFALFDSANVADRFVSATPVSNADPVTLTLVFQNNANVWGVHIREESDDHLFTRNGDCMIIVV